jgi:hypothetical protein
MTNRCPRCERGSILGTKENASCISCGYSPVGAAEYASAEAWLATAIRNEAGEVVLPREVDAKRMGLAE